MLTISLSYCYAQWYCSERHFAKWHYSECRFLRVILLNVIILNITQQSVMPLH
jgi:hypothetical protein